MSRMGRSCSTGTGAAPRSIPGGAIGWRPGRNRIESARVPGVATGDPPPREPGAAKRAEAADRPDRILRTGRMEPAARTDQRTHREAVHLDDGDQRGLHSSASVVQCRSSALRSTARCSWSAAARATTTKSNPASRFWFSRKLSRTSRFRRLRRFARRTRFFATASPRRAWPALRTRARTEKYRPDERTGASNTRRKSRVVRRRRSRPNERSRARVRGSRRQAHPALGAPRLEDPPPRAGAHLGTEAAAAFRTANAGLKRSLHSVWASVWTGGAKGRRSIPTGGSKCQRSLARRGSRKPSSAPADGPRPDPLPVSRQRRRSAATGTTPTDCPESMSVKMTSRTSSRSRS